MRQHQLDIYKDGYQSIQFCKICSAEGEKLSQECVGTDEDEFLKEKIKNILNNIRHIYPSFWVEAQCSTPLIAKNPVVIVPRQP